ncbi:hypothetical protein GCK32_009489 [Trichostrongylus colubriformis]|uniref:Uncharacterized protein n=1 Tax=Trichostrongylus colubriformis TaxID=6319 RepID=A0AAN8FYM8_TRICO
MQFFAVLALILSVAAFPAEVKDHATNESRKVADVRDGPCPAPGKSASVKPEADATVPDTFTPSSLEKGPQKHHYPGCGYYPDPITGIIQALLGPLIGGPFG